MTWSLKEKNGNNLEPLKFSNGKTQKDIVNEVIDAIKQGHKIIFLKGICGSGKSAIALNIAKEMGRASIVVPVKYLQQQYQEDYGNNMSVLKDDGKPLSIQNLTGRNNFECIYNEGCKADDRFLPCSIDIKKKNWDLIRAYLENNPAVDAGNFKSIDDVRRISVAAACPHWSPVIGKDWFGDYGLKDAKQHVYKGLKDKGYIYYKRKPGCGYYEQFMSYVNADILIFNSRKYEIENIMDRKPSTDVEIIDECDEFLDNLNNEKRINLEFMKIKLEEVLAKAKDEDVKNAVEGLLEIIHSLLNARWINEMIENEEILEIKDTKILQLIGMILNNEFLLEYEELEPYFQIAKSFESMLDDTYISFTRNIKDNLMVKIVNINLEKKLSEIIEKNKAFVMMSGTLHSEEVLRDIFGLKDFIVIEAETNHQGIIRKNLTGMEKSYRWKDFKEGRVTREDYLKSLEVCILNAEKPFLVHVNSFLDLPSEEEKDKYNVDIMSRDKLRELQDKYKKGELLQMFRGGKIDVLYSTKCNRGVDLPGDMCRSIIFTKYPYPGMQNIFWKILQKKDQKKFSEFYFDKARREFLQRIYRGLRSNSDIVNVLSPDSMVIQKSL